jgi:glycosyltransferase involved in cell wall biosynthesis
MKVSVVVPTMATHERASLLKRAIDSIRQSSTVPTNIVVVVNGKKYDSAICEWLKEQSDITFDFLETPSLPAALRRGIELVSTEYFAMLDDDDEYLPLAIDERLRMLESDRDIDLVITNGYRHVHGTDEIWYEDLDVVNNNPLQSLMTVNWLSSCNALYRKLSIGPEFFTDIHPFAEWTWLAYQIVLAKKRIGVVNKPTFRIHDTPGSLSKSPAFSASYISLFKKMLALNPPREIGLLIRRKLGSAYHDASNAAMYNGTWREALKLHWKSLLENGGIRYLGYSRHFLTRSKFVKRAKP